MYVYRDIYIYMYRESEREGEREKKSALSIIVRKVQSALSALAGCLDALAGAWPSLLAGCWRIHWALFDQFGSWAHSRGFILALFGPGPLGPFSHPTRSRLI